MASFTVRTVLGDPVAWDISLLPPSTPRDVDELRRCKSHKHYEGSLLVKLPEFAAVLDVGGHFGDTTITLALRASSIGRGDLRFFYFEPSKAKCGFVRAMIESNELGNVHVINKAVGDRCQKVRGVPTAKGSVHGGNRRYQTAETDSSDATLDATGVSLEPKASDSVLSDIDPSDSDSSDDDDDTVYSMITLDSIKDTLTADGPVGLIHIDVEGWESRVLTGASNLLQSSACSDTTVIAEAWTENEAKKRGMSDPVYSIVAAMKPFSPFIRLPDIVDQERNVVYKSSIT